MRRLLLLTIAVLLVTEPVPSAQRTARPPLHGRHWVAITGKPLGATAGAMIFQKGGNAVDAACAMLGAVATMWDTLGWGGETQALIYNPKTKKVVGINALGVAPTGATPDFYRQKGLRYPPEYGPLAAVTPGTPGGLMVMLAEFGTLSLADVLAPAILMADGYAIEAQAADAMERQKAEIKKWSVPEGRVPAPCGSGARSAARRRDFQAGGSRGDAAQARQRRTPGARVRQEPQGSHPGRVRPLLPGRHRAGVRPRFARARWPPHDPGPRQVEGARRRAGDDRLQGRAGLQAERVDEGPALLQTLNILEGVDVKAMGYNSARYVHALYQAMNLAFADRDFYYGDTYVAPEEPVKGLLSKDYANVRAKQIDWSKNDPGVKPGDPYPFQGGTNPFQDLLQKWGATATEPGQPNRAGNRSFGEGFTAGTTSIQAADKEGWVVSVTPSGGWIPAAIAGRTGIGMSQRMQSFVLDRSEGPFNVLEPGKRPRVTLTPSLALKDGRPYLSFSVQGGDGQDQNLLQFFLNVVEFGMTVQQAVEAANFNSYQMRSSFDDHKSEPGRITLNEGMPSWVRDELRRMGYRLDFERLTSGPINAIFFDWKNGSIWGGSSNHGEDYGIAW